MFNTFLLTNITHYQVPSCVTAADVSWAGKERVYLISSESPEFCRRYYKKTYWSFFVCTHRTCALLYDLMNSRSTTNV